jgi:hypothetical protein
MSLVDHMEQHVGGVGADLDGVHLAPHDVARLDEKRPATISGGSQPPLSNKYRLS